MKKKTIIILSLTLATVSSVFGQKDSTIKPFTDTTSFTLNLKETEASLNAVKANVTVAEWENFWKIFSYLVQIKQREYEAKSKKK